ncbi:hypothetical protein BC830DRAFT_1117518 [Chytriomyces sp. MP71]|nr:hypothetical protein BC830DRAFT_1117518 [Chytriomyces sp. MP71]
MAFSVFTMSSVGETLGQAPQHEMDRAEQRREKKRRRKERKERERARECERGDDDEDGVDETGPALVEETSGTPSKPPLSQTKVTKSRKTSKTVSNIKNSTTNQAQKSPNIATDPLNSATLRALFEAGSSAHTHASAIGCEYCLLCVAREYVAHLEWSLDMAKQHEAFPSRKESEEAQRNALSCAICCDILATPHMLACGHSFCFACIHAWLTGNPHKSKRKCPTCRIVVSRPPALNLSLQDQIDAFVRTHVPAGNERDAALEARVQAQRQFRDACTDGDGDVGRKSPWDALFAALLDPNRQKRYDAEDGVYRCGSCNWEVDGNQCSNTQCGIVFEGDDEGDGDPDRVVVGDFIDDEAEVDGSDDFDGEDTDSDEDDGEEEPLGIDDSTEGSSMDGFVVDSDEEASPNDEDVGSDVEMTNADSSAVEDDSNDEGLSHHHHRLHRAPASFNIRNPRLQRDRDRESTRRHRTRGNAHRRIESSDNDDDDTDPGKSGKRSHHSVSDYTDRRRPLAALSSSPSRQRLSSPLASNSRGSTPQSGGVASRTPSPRPSTSSASRSRTHLSPNRTHTKRRRRAEQDSDTDGEGGYSRAPDYDARRRPVAALPSSSESESSDVDATAWHDVLGIRGKHSSSPKRKGKTASVVVLESDDDRVDPHVGKGKRNVPVVVENYKGEVGASSKSQKVGNRKEGKGGASPDRGKRRRIVDSDED